MRRTAGHSALALALVLLGSPVRAQTVRGSVHEETGRPVGGALLVLVDSAGSERLRVLSAPDGSFSMRAPAAGRYRLRIERIGIRTPDLVPLALEPGATVVRRIVVASQAIALPPLTASARRQCTLRPAQGEAVALLWEEARKALRAFGAERAGAQYGMRVRRFVRRLDPQTLLVLRDSSYERVEERATTPFASAPAPELIARGFIQHTDSGTYYYAPDAAVLLSDEFAQAYCLTPVEDRKRRLLGIEFRPASGRGAPAVTGTLWLDERTFELRHIGFGYARGLPDGADRAAGGRVELQRLPEGAWLISRWHIRFPLLVERPGIGLARAPQLHVGALREVGGEILEIVGADGAIVSTLVPPSLGGIAFDSIAGLPLAGATVFIAGLEQAATTSPAGEYRFRSLPQGRYRVGVSHPRLAAYASCCPPAW